MCVYFMQMISRHGTVLERQPPHVLDVPSSRLTHVLPNTIPGAVHPLRQLPPQIFQQHRGIFPRPVSSDILPPSSAGWRITSYTYSTSACSSLSPQPSLSRGLTVSLCYVLYQLYTYDCTVDYSVEREHAGLRRIAGYGVTVTRGAASCMMWAYSVLLLTMARNFITFLRETPFNQYVPFDAAVSFHKIIALTALFFTIMHAVGHGINFYHIATQTSSDLTCLFREVFHRTHTLPKFSYWLFLTATG